MTIKQILLCLFARKRLILAVTGCVVAIVIIVSLVLPKTYKATTSVVVDLQSSDPVVGTLTPGQILAEYMATQIDIITSERVARQVIKGLNPEQTASMQKQWQQETGGEKVPFDSWLVAQILRHVDAMPSRQSSVLNISYSAGTPKQAAEIANAISRAYIDVNLELKVDPAKHYAAWFDDRQKSLKENVELARAKLSAFQKSHGIVATDDERLDVENTRLAELSTQLSTVQSQRADSQSRQKQTPSNDAMPETIQNVLIQNLRTDLSKLEAEQSQLSGRVGPNHPEFKRITAEIESVRERLALETQRITNSLSTVDRINASREADVRAKLAQQKSHVLELKAAHDEIAVLQRDVESAQKAYDLVTQRLAQSNLESQSQQTNVAILTYATPPLTHASPRLRLNAQLALVLGLLLGIGAALILEINNRRVRTKEDFAELGLPLLAVLDSTKPRITFGRLSNAGRLALPGPTDHAMRIG